MGMISTGEIHLRLDYEFLLFLDTEHYLQSVCLGILGVNTLSSFATALLNMSRNKPWVYPSFSALGIGVVNLIQHVFEDEKTSIQKLTPITAIAAAFGGLVLIEAILKSAHIGGL